MAVLKLSVTGTQVQIAARTLLVPVQYDGHDCCRPTVDHYTIISQRFYPRELSIRFLPWPAQMAEYGLAGNEEGPGIAAVEAKRLTAGCINLLTKLGGSDSGKPMNPTAVSHETTGLAGRLGRAKRLSPDDWHFPTEASVEFSRDPLMTFRVYWQFVAPASSVLWTQPHMS